MNVISSGSVIVGSAIIGAIISVVSIALNFIKGRLIKYVKKNVFR